MTYIKGFDGLRALSIIMVLLTHLGFYATFNEGSFLFKNFYLLSGSTGVMVFFTISCFLITSILIREKFKHQKINFKNFFAKRFLRLLPPLLVFFSVISILMVLNYLPENYKAVVLSFFYLYNYVSLVNYTGELGHTWSLAVEEQFYLLWPLVIAYFKTFKKLWVFIMILIAICLFVKGYYRSQFVFMGNRIDIFENYFPDRWFIPACLPIILGSFFALVVFFKEKFSRQIGKRKEVLFVAIICYTIKVFFPQLKMELVTTFQSLGVILFLVWIYFNQNSVMVKILEIPMFTFIGRISYGLYVYQGLFLRTGPGGDLWFQKFPQNIILVFLTAIGSYYTLEKPALMLKKRFTNQ
jgi:peptidoglycan/LPS O-acetylase OafA/YrhL